MTLSEFVLCEHFVLLRYICFKHSYGNTFCKTFFFRHSELLLLQLIYLMELLDKLTLCFQFLHLLVDDIVQQTLHLRLLLFRQELRLGDCLIFDLLKLLLVKDVANQASAVRWDQVVAGVGLSVVFEVLDLL